MTQEQIDQAKVRAREAKYFEGSAMDIGSTLGFVILDLADDLEKWRSFGKLCAAKAEHNPCFTVYGADGEPSKRVCYADCLVCAAERLLKGEPR